MLKRITAFFLSICLTVFLCPMNAFAEAGDWDPLTDPDKVLGTMVGSKTFSSSTTIELGQDGYLRTMPTLDSGNYSYNAMAYCGATAKSNNTNIVQVKSIEIGTWQGGVWDGADALQVTVTPQSVGTTVIVINYYYTFSQHATPFNNPNAQWFYATVNYTVTVKNSSTPPAETTYVLKYDANGGNNAPTSQSASSTATSYTFNISAATPTKDNYTFLGWADNADAITATYQPEGQITLQKSSPTKTLYAVWQENPPATTYTVIYTDGVDGEEVFPDQVYSNLANGDETPAFVGTPTRSGYTFKGWNPTVAATVTGNATYTATWEEVPPATTYTVTYTDGVDGEEVFPDQVYSNLANGDETPAFVGTPTRSSYTFKGWNPTVAATVTGNTTYTATWEEVPPATTYTVTYTDGVDGEEVFPDQVYSNLANGDKTPAFVGTPTRSGYTFKGWNPTVAATVTGNATYTATWEEINSNPTPELPELPYWPSVEQPEDNEEELDNNEVPLVPGTDIDTTGETEEAIPVTSPDGNNTENIDDETVPQVDAAPQTGSKTAGSLALLVGSAVFVIAIHRKRK